MKHIIRHLASIATVLALAATLSACKTTPTNPDSFFQTVVSCAETNPNNDQAGQAVLNCFMNAVGGDYVACIAGITAAGNWTVAEIACVIRQYATESAQRINAGTPTPSDSVILERANAWIRQEQVKYR